MMREEKICQNCKNEFVIGPEDFKFYEKIQVPPPTFCPECRLQRRLAWRNEYILYKRKCSAPGHSEEIISYFSLDKPFTVYDQKYWWSDKWDQMQYGQDYDFSKPFFEQFKKLLQKTPKPCLTSNYSTMVNSEYSNWAGALRNCYLITDADYVEDSAYGSGVMESKDCFDCDTILRCEFCYECFNATKGYQVFYSVDCENCNDVWFSKNLVGCHNCIGCVNLRNSAYHIFNKPYAKEEYLKKRDELNLRSYENILGLQKKAHQFWLRWPVRYYHGSHNQNVSGDYVFHSKNVAHAFLITDVEDSKFISLMHARPTKDSYDYTDWGEKAERLYECMSVGLGAFNVKFSQLVFNNVRDVEYSYFCTNSSYLFGCANIRNKQYCILNKQYSKTEYESLIPNVKKHMNDMPYKDEKGREYRYGEFFPVDLAPFAYNESVAQEYLPRTKEEIIRAGHAYKEINKPAVSATISFDRLPDTIDTVDTKFFNHIIGCQHQGKCSHPCTIAFRLIPQELAFYKKMGIPLPRLCSRCRHYERIKNRNPLTLWHRQCQCAGVQSDNGIYKNTIAHFHKQARCSSEFETSYSPERPEIVYCEQCYLSEVV